MNKDFPKQHQPVRATDAVLARVEDTVDHPHVELCWPSPDRVNQRRLVIGKALQPM